MADTTRAQKIKALLERGPDDTRRLALDRADVLARTTSTFGSKEHRETRDRVERAHDDARRVCEALSDEALDAALAADSA